MAELPPVEQAALAKGRNDEEMVVEKAEPVITVGETSLEYQEFLRLSEIFQGDRYKKLVRKIDWRVIPQLQLIYLFSIVDRTNIGNARLFHAERDMGLTGTDWNVSLGIFFITYALSGPPSNLVLKRFGPKIVLPTLLLCVSLVLIGSGCCRTKAQWYACRLLLGIFEAGMFPGTSYTLTTWYNPAELCKRIAWLYTGSPIAGAVSGLLAFGIGQLDGIWGYSGWRWIYVLEGCFSAALALVSYWWVQSTPDKQGRWLVEEERQFLLLRNRFGYGGGGEHGGSKQDFSWRDVKQSFKSWHVGTVIFMYFTCCVALYGFIFTLPSIINNLGYSTVNAQALSAPPYILSIPCIFITAHLSDKYATRMLAVWIPSVVAIVGLAFCFSAVGKPNLIGLAYTGVLLTGAGIYSLSPILSTWVAVNTAGNTKRAAAMAFVIVGAQLGGLVGSNIYLLKEKPYYATGFGASIAFLAFGNLIVPIIYWYAIGRVNKKRDLLLENSEADVRSQYTTEKLQDMGDLSPYYRYER